LFGSSFFQVSQFHWIDHIIRIILAESLCCHNMQLFLELCPRLELQYPALLWLAKRTYVEENLEDEDNGLGLKPA
jgi:hypothetical protein